MSDFSNQLKAKADIGRLIGEFVALKPGGNGFTGLCPFHSEKSPSFHVHVAKQFYYCFGCHASGDVFQFFIALKKLTFPEAVAEVAERMGIAVPEYSGGDADPQRQELLRIHLAAAEYFQSALDSREGASARAYLRERELPPEAWPRFQLGYAPEGGRGLALFLENRSFAPDLALRAGLCQLRRESTLRDSEPRTGPHPVLAATNADARWSDLYDRFRQRLIFPIADDRGRPIAFGGRALQAANADPDRKAPKYLNSPESPLYTKGRVLYNLDRAREAIRQLNYVILVEGYFDCMRVFLAGFENVVASCGTALTASQIHPVARWVQKAVVNFDPDTAGAAAAERSIGMLLEEGFQMRIVALPGGLDPDLFIRHQGRDAYAEALRSSRSFFDYLADRARQQFDLRRAEGKIAALNHLLPYLSRVHDPILRQSLAENLAAQLEIQQPLISKQLLRAVSERRAALAPEAAAAPPLTTSERLVLRAWLEWEPQRAEIAATLTSEQLLRGLASAPLAEQLFVWPGGDLAALAASLPEPDRRLMAELLMGSDDPLTPATVRGALDALRELRYPQAVRDFQQRIQAAARQGDTTLLKEVLREKQAWDQQTRPNATAAAAGRRNGS